MPPLEPTGPSRATIALAGMMLGLLAGIGLGGCAAPIESLRESARARAPLSGMPSGAGRSTVAGLQPADHDCRRPAKPNRTETDTEAAEPQETDMNPLARLMERIRRPDSADWHGAAGPRSEDYRAGADGASAPDPREPSQALDARGQSGSSRHVSLSAAARPIRKPPYPYAPSAQPAAATVPQPAAGRPIRRTTRSRRSIRRTSRRSTLAYPYPPPAAAGLPRLAAAAGRRRRLWPSAAGRRRIPLPDAAPAGAGRAYPQDRQPADAPEPIGSVQRSRAKCRRSRKSATACANSARRSANSPKAARAAAISERAEFRAVSSLRHRTAL